MQLVIDVKSKRRIAERLKKATVDKSYLMKEASNISEYIEKSLGISGFQGFENGNSYVYSEI